MNYDRVILELLDRVSSLEESVNQLKAITSTASALPPISTYSEPSYEQSEDYSSILNVRDTTKYIFDGKRYGKNRLVLAVVQAYVKENPDISAAKLMAVFDKTIQGSLGVLRPETEVKKSYNDYERRFFCAPNEIIRTSTENCVVCTQWGKFNISNFITRAEQLGMHIQVIGSTAANKTERIETMNKSFAIGQLIGQEKFMDLYSDLLLELHYDMEFMEFIRQLRKQIDGAELTNTKAANTEIMHAFYYANINRQFEQVAEIVDRVKSYGKQASAHISIYYAMYVLDFQ